MRTKSILTEAKQIERAVTLISLGARLQVLETETDLSYERLLRLYKEVAGKSPSKGQLPFSTDWFMTWQPNIHASLFLNIHEYLNKVAEMDEIDTVIKAYQLYIEQITGSGSGAAAVGHARLAAGEVHRQRHADDDQVLQVRRPLRDPSARDRPALRVRPVQPARACRQGPPERLAARNVGNSLIFCSRSPHNGCGPADGIGRPRLNCLSPPQWHLPVPLRRVLRQRPLLLVERRRAPCNPLKSVARAPIRLKRWLCHHGRRPTRKRSHVRHHRLGVALGCIFGVFIAHGGNISVILHAMPFEMIAICGAALGAFLANNQMKVLKASAARPGQLLQGQQVHQGALHGADGAALRHPAEGAQGRPDVDREGRRGAAQIAAVPEVPDRRQRPPRQSSSSPTTCA